MIFHDQLSHVEGEPPSRFRARLFAQFEVVIDNQPVETWVGLKGVTMLKYLLATERKSASADALIDLLWPGDANKYGVRPEDWADLARMRLYATVSQLRRSLQGGRKHLQPWIFVTESVYRLEPREQIWTDLDAFTTLSHQGSAAAERGDFASARSTFGAAINLYRGALLLQDGNVPWLEPIRSQSARTAMTMLSSLAHWDYNIGDYQRCRGWLERALGADQGREDLQRLLMRCYHQLGLRSLALRQYEQCVTALREEFDAEPEPETVALYNRLRRSDAV